MDPRSEVLRNCEYVGTKMHSESHEFIYALVDPNDGAVRYIGRTKDINKRVWGHVKDETNRGQTYKDLWIKSLLMHNKRPILAVMDIVSKSKGGTVEAEYLEWYKNRGIIFNEMGGNFGEWALRYRNSAYKKTSKRAIANLERLNELNRLRGRNEKRRNNSRPIIQYDMNGTPLRIWRCRADIAEAFGVNQKSASNLSSCLHGHRNLWLGYHWEFKK